ncbi:MAG: outer membrane protein assembly factor BamE [Kordiimonadaceae bacterium]|jgi:outer membrane protein assembly factor BamE (lipoprotein component of BamABCDE complex)|nr:outer membrane protein assembly factor BamE [Kordiimonadaceae bacterium]MBT6035417.1 outer membrane protein assembly factor BamE [Kordiimonadaceae bacterium]MBT6330693.1 outer membrane protein assembly factor BamE [Kordiimonadaceae bacterium]MBT7581776.1 outer membrane protein assembly factor BamE [Kordiimonadaceae bacterium]
MKPIIHKIIFTLIFTAVLSGCAAVKESRGYIPDQKLIDAIRVEVDSKESVETMLGNPTMKATFDDLNWYYHSKKTERWAFLKEKVTEMDILAITFDDQNYVSNIRHYNVKDNKVIDPVSKRTVTHGKDLNFFAELFGNVGRFGAAGGGPEAGN